MLTTLALYGLAAPDLVDVLAAAREQMSAVRLAVAQTFHWAADFDARLLGCPTIIIQQH